MNFVKVYIVFHKQVFPNNTRDFTKEEIKNYFTWMGVNEKIPKELPDEFKEYNILYEYELKKHNPLYQMLNFYQNSVFFHLYHNPDIVKSRYIGFSQYDMSINAEQFRNCLKEMYATPFDKAVGFYLYPSLLLFDPFPEQFWNIVFFEPYQEHYKIKVQYKDIQSLPLCLLHTFIIPSWFFFHMMPFIEKILPKVLKLLNWETRHLAGTLERLFALCINCAVFEGKITQLMPSHAMKHEETQHMEDALRGIKAGKDVSQ
jgi:hypothetical protein